MKNFVRATTLIGYRQMVSELGANPDRLLKRFHIEPQVIENGEGVLPYRSIIRLFEATAAILQRPDFGMQLAQHQGLEVVGPLAAIGMNSPTLGHALDAIFENIDFYSDALRVEIDRKTDSRLPRIVCEMNVDHEPHRRQYVERMVCLICRDLKTLSKGKVIPRSVFFRHSTTLPASTYRKYFSAPVFFEQDINAVILRSEDLQYPLDNTNPHLQSIITNYVRQSISSHPVSLKTEVEFLVKRLLSSRLFGLPQIAANLCMHERTLQRKLKDEGHKFDEIVETIRRERAEELLKNSRLSMAQIALQLGYVEQTSFIRASIRWFGKPPLQVRRQYLNRQH